MSGNNLQPTVLPWTLAVVFGSLLFVSPDVAVKDAFAGKGTGTSKDAEELAEEDPSTNEEQEEAREDGITLADVLKFLGIGDFEEF